MKASKDKLILRGTVSAPDKPTKEEVLELVVWLESLASRDDRKEKMLKAARYLFWELGRE